MLKTSFLQIFSILTLCFTTQASSINYKILELNELSTALTAKISSQNKIESLSRNSILIDTNQDYLDDFKQLNEQSQKYIAVAKEVSKRLKQNLDNNDVLLGDDFSTIENLLRSLLIIAETNLQIIYKHDPDASFSYSLNLSDKNKTFSSLLSFGLNLNFFNIFNETFKLFLTHDKLRRIVIDTYNTQKIYYPYLEKINEYLEIINDDKFRGYLINSSVFYDLNREKVLQQNKPLLTNTISIIDSNPIKRNLLTQIYAKYEFVQAPDIFVKIIAKSTNFISKLFGNLVGKLRWRHGYLYEHTKGRELIKAQLRPLDIISEKTPFAATDLFIPGHFGHIALYLGTREQLIEIGLWNDPLIIPYQNQINAGKNILESIRPGSHLTSLDKFLEIDEITIIKQPDLMNQNDNMKKVYKKAFEQLGKAYDFNFDVHTLSTVVCSEIIYHAFGHIKWPTVYRFGRNTITPDDVIELSYYDHAPVKFMNSYIGKKTLEVKKVDMPSIGAKLSLIKRANRDGLKSYSYDKSSKECKTVQISNRSSSYPRFKKICSTKMKQLVYDNK